MKIFIVSLFLLSACSSIPQKLQVSDDTLLTPFSDVRSIPTSNIGNNVRWGGVIASVTNNADNTMVEVVHFELNSSSRPKQINETKGRFKLYFSGLLDPVIYKEGKSITAVGVVGEPEHGKIGEHEYLFPVMKAQNIHLWNDIKRVEVIVKNDPLWGYPNFRHYPFYSHNRPIIIKSSKRKNINSPQQIQKK